MLWFKVWKNEALGFLSHKPSQAFVKNKYEWSWMNPWLGQNSWMHIPTTWSSHSLIRLTQLSDNFHSFAYILLVHRTILRASVVPSQESTSKIGGITGFNKYCSCLMKSRKREINKLELLPNLWGLVDRPQISLCG